MTLYDLIKTQLGDKASQVLSSSSSLEDIKDLYPTVYYAIKLYSFVNPTSSFINWLKNIDV